MFGITPIIIHNRVESLRKKNGGETSREPPSFLLRVVAVVVAVAVVVSAVVAWYDGVFA